jgi:hypothetical protein
MGFVFIFSDAGEWPLRLPVEFRVIDLVQVMNQHTASRALAGIEELIVSMSCTSM